MEPLKDSGWKRSKLNKGGREISVVWHRAMGRANRSTESPFVPGSSSPPIHIQRLVDPKSYLGSSPIPFQPSRADGNALSKSVKSSADFVSPKFSRQWTMEYFAATRSLIGLAFNPNFHFRSLNSQSWKSWFYAVPTLFFLCRATVFRGEGERGRVDRARFVSRFKKIATGAGDERDEGIVEGSEEVSSNCCFAPN